MEGKQYSHKFSQTAYFDNTDWYFGLDYSQNCIDIINLTHQNFHKSLCFINDGSEGSIDVADFYFHNKDSIILLSNFGKIQIINFNGALTDEYDLNSEKADKWVEDELLSGIESGPPRIHYDDLSKNLYIPSYAPVYNTDSHYLSSPTLVSYNLKKREYEEIGSLIPEDIKGKKVSPIIDSHEYNIVKIEPSGNILISYMASSFFSFGKLGASDSLKLFCRTSKFLENNIIDFNGDINDINHQRNYQIQAGRYDKSIYLPEINRFIVSVRHNQQLKDLGGNLNNPFHSDFSILVLNENFKTLKEFKVPKEKYNFNKVYPHSKGVLILKENPNDENNEEDLLEFSVFAID
ncbi:DUF4221 family protein [Marivirga sp.]|uniref:DUF4221 family protein n=1 Tax=Marivirga sp. TaxID=2018662 RepID=UPI003DA6E423